MKPAEDLTGLDLQGGWHVDGRVTQSAKGTGEYSSISYFASNEKKEKAFLKAIDLSSALQDDDLMGKLHELSVAYEHEFNLLHQCKDKRLRRVVVPIAEGLAQVSELYKPLDRVPYIIFPRAEGNIRDVLERWREFEKKFDLAWALRCLHHSATGLQELHGMNIAHQDVKPSNILVYPVEGSKITDLGSASQAGNPSRSDKWPVAGDVRYATPEQWYSWSQSAEFENRYLVDLYRLGSLMFFFFSDLSAMDALQLKLSSQYGKDFVKSDFISDLPYLKYAFKESLDGLRESVEKIAGGLTDQIIMIAGQLCDPDPRKRGDPRAGAAKYREQHDMQAYVSRFNILARRAEIRMI